MDAIRATYGTDRQWLVGSRAAAAERRLGGRLYHCFVFFVKAILNGGARKHDSDHPKCTHTTHSQCDTGLGDLCKSIELKQNTTKVGQRAVSVVCGIALFLTDVISPGRSDDNSQFCSVSMQDGAIAATAGTPSASQNHIRCPTNSKAVLAQSSHCR